MEKCFNMNKNKLSAMLCCGASFLNKYKKEKNKDKSNDKDKMEN